MPAAPQLASLRQAISGRLEAVVPTCTEHALAVHASRYAFKHLESNLPLKSIS